MVTGNLRSLLGCTLALLFGLVQIVCACLSTSQNAFGARSTNVSPIIVSAQHDVSHHASHDHDAKHSVVHDHGSHHEKHTEGCTHCDGYVALTKAASADISVDAEAHTLQKFMRPSLTVPKVTRASMSPSALAGLRWLDPPKPTLVSLKILIQT